MHKTLMNLVGGHAGSTPFSSSGFIVLLLVIGAVMTLALLGFFAYVFTRKQE